MKAQQVVFRARSVAAGWSDPNAPLLPAPEYVWEIERRYDLDPETAELVAHVCVQEQELVAQLDAKLVFLSDGSGPYCSHCGAIGMLCGHGARRDESPEALARNGGAE